MWLTAVLLDKLSVFLTSLTAFLTSLTAFLVSLTFLSEPVSRFPAFVVPIPGFVDFVLETLTFSSENDESFAYYIYYV